MEASREIDSLNNKLGALENKVKSIKTQQADSSLKIFDQDENIDISNLTLGEDQFKVGRFHKKQALKQPLPNKMESTNPITNNTSGTVTRRVTVHIVMKAEQVIIPDPKNHIWYQDRNKQIMK